MEENLYLKNQIQFASCFLTSIKYNYTSYISRYCSYIHDTTNLNSLQQLLCDLRHLLILFWTLNTLQPLPNPIELDVGFTQHLSSTFIVITPVQATTVSLLYGDPGYHQLSLPLGLLLPLLVYSQDGSSGESLWDIGLLPDFLHKIYQLCSCVRWPYRSRPHTSLTTSPTARLPFYNPNIGSWTCQAYASLSFNICSSSEMVCPVDSSIAQCQLFKSNISL